MNSKKVIVVILLITTVIIGIIAIYLIASLTSTPQNIDDNLPTVTATIVATTIPTETSACGKSCTNNSCEEGNTCLVVGGFRRCVANACLDEQGIPTVNTGCSSDYCTAENVTPTVTTTNKPQPTNVNDLTVNISKRAVYQCSSQPQDRVVLIELAITNEGDSADQFSIVDDLATAFSVDLVVQGSISNNGSVVNNSINWQKITIPANATIKVSYKVALSENANGETFSNTVVITNSESARTEKLTSFTIEFIPCTDLDGDQIVVLVTGLVMLIFGLLSFKLQWNQKIGSYLWNHGLEKSYSEARTVKEVFNDNLSSIKITISLFKEGFNKRVSLWKRNQKLTTKQKFEQDLIKPEDNE